MENKKISIITKKLNSIISEKLSLDIAIKAVLVAGIILRICYMLYTGPGTRTHDVYRDEWGHLDYIRYIAENHALPPVNTCQAYHPPVHHIIAAFVLKISKIFTEDEIVSLKIVQASSALSNCLTLLTFYKTMKLLRLKRAALLAASSIFAFHPTNIYFASKINNDNTMMFFYTLAFYFLVKWMTRPSTGDVMFLAITSSLAVLTKKSALILFVLISAVFFKVLMENRSSPGKYMRQYSIFCLLAIPLSFSHNMRNYMLFKQSFSYVPSLGQGFEPTFFNLVNFPVNNLLKNPFNNGGLKGGEYFLEFLFKSSLFGEWPYPGLETIASLLLFLAAANFVIMVVCIFQSKIKDVIKSEYLLLLNMAVPFIMAMKFRTDFPVACSQDFRYIAPVLISVSYYLGKAVNSLGIKAKTQETSPKKFKDVGLKQRINSGRLHVAATQVYRFSALAFIAAFCIVSAIFVLCLRNYQ